MLTNVKGEPASSLSVYPVVVLIENSAMHNAEWIYILYKRVEHGVFAVYYAK